MKLHEASRRCLVFIYFYFFYFDYFLLDSKTLTTPKSPKPANHEGKSPNDGEPMFGPYDLGVRACGDDKRVFFSFFFLSYTNY